MSRMRRPDMGDLVRFCAQARGAATPLAFAEVVLGRLDEYDESFFGGMAALAHRARSLGDTDGVKNIEGLVTYIRWAMEAAEENGVDRLRDTLV
jgi:hypothetical protein